jgi:uncharacterized damage-inducible protein DinB
MPAHVPPVADERAGLIGFLAHQRLAARTAAYGLTDSEAGLTPTASSLSVGGLLKHLAGCERSWMDHIQQIEREPDYEAYVRGFTFLETDSIEAVIADYDAACQATDAVLAGVADLGRPVPVPDAPWFPSDVEAWSVRWVVLHLIEETARHAGHADIIRESIDGAQSGSLLATAEDWAPAPWVAKWTRANAHSNKEEASVGAA